VKTIVLFLASPHGLEGAVEQRFELGFPSNLGRESSLGPSSPNTGIGTDLGEVSRALQPRLSDSIRQLNPDGVLDNRRMI